ncbi:hypothetical protein KAU11_07450, partial [Candidatus Babeliales bacterium]|nr:hypothetical protein [Candidatus Babeliales bacterium]
MNDFSIYKLAKGAYNISVEQGTKTSSVTGIVNNDIAEDTASEKHYIKSTNSYAVSRNTILTATESSGNGKGFGNGFYPTTFAWHYDINKDHANRITTERFHYSQITPNIFIDGYADVYRIVDGAYKNVRTSKVVNGNFGEWSTLHRDVTTTGLSLETKFAHWNGRNVTLWVGVAAIDSNGRAGAVGYLPTVIPSNKSKESPTKDAFNTGIPWSFGGSLPAPTGLTMTHRIDNEDIVMNSWDTVEGAVGYVVLISWGDDPASHPEKPYLELENDGGVALQKGDHTIIRKRIDNPSIDMISPRVYGDNASTKLIRS